MRRNEYDDDGVDNEGDSDGREGKSWGEEEGVWIFRKEGEEGWKKDKRKIRREIEVKKEEQRSHYSNLWIKDLLKFENIFSFHIYYQQSIIFPFAIYLRTVPLTVSYWISQLTAANALIGRVDTNVSAALFASIHLCDYVSICVSIYLPLYLSIFLSIYLSIYLNIYLSVCLPVS